MPEIYWLILGRLWLILVDCHDLVWTVLMATSDKLTRHEVITSNEFKVYYA